VQLNVQISQGSVATCFRRGGRFYSCFFCRLSKIARVEFLFNSVRIFGSYHRKKSWKIVYFVVVCLLLISLAVWKACVFLCHRVCWCFHVQECSVTTGSRHSSCLKMEVSTGRLWVTLAFVIIVTICQILFHDFRIFYCQHICFASITVSYVWIVELLLNPFTVVLLKSVCVTISYA